MNSHKKILIALTSHNTLGNSKKPTGYWLSELTHFYDVLKKAGYDIDIMSPKGGEAPMDPGSKTRLDRINAKYLKDPEFTNKIRRTLSPNQVDPSEYAAIYYPGGHGPMWDLSNDKYVSEIAREIYEQGGVISAVCHGPAALLPIVLSDGTPILTGKTVTGVSNLEERLIRKTKYMPFLLENALKERSEKYTKTFPGLAKVAVSDRIVTGQNPHSAKPVAKRTLELLQETKEIK